MQTLVIVFIAAVAVMVIVSAVIFGFTFFKTARFTNKVFDHAERELDRRASESKAPQHVVCNYCGSKVATGQQCSNCGAPLS